MITWWGSSHKGMVMWWRSVVERIFSVWVCAWWSSVGTREAACTDYNTDMESKCRICELKYVLASVLDAKNPLVCVLVLKNQLTSSSGCV